MNDVGVAMLNGLAARIVQDCQRRGWKLDWSARGCYLMLEGAEPIEALRGKCDPVDEAADVLRVYLSIVGAFDIEMGAVLKRMAQKMDSP